LRLQLSTVRFDDNCNRGLSFGVVIIFDQLDF
jgi:hypothetical protein